MEKIIFQATFPKIFSREGEIENKHSSSSNKLSSTIIKIDKKPKNNDSFYKLVKTFIFVIKAVKDFKKSLIKIKPKPKTLLLINDLSALITYQKIFVKNKFTHNLSYYSFILIGFEKMLKCMPIIHHTSIFLKLWLLMNEFIKILYFL